MQDLSSMETFNTYVGSPTLLPPPIPAMPASAASTIASLLIFETQSPPPRKNGQTSFRRVAAVDKMLRALLTRTASGVA